MSALAIGLRKLYGLFVDDLGYALAIAAWIVLAVAFLRFLDPTTRGIVLFGGLAVILVVSVRRGARG
jgi:uncharacterized membrane protein